MIYLRNDERVVGILHTNGEITWMADLTDNEKQTVLDSMGNDTLVIRNNCIEIN